MRELLLDGIRTMIHLFCRSFLFLTTFVLLAPAASGQEEEQNLLETGGFEGASWEQGDRIEAALVGQGGWVAFPGGGGEALIVTGNRAPGGSNAVRSLSSATSAAAHPIAFDPAGQPRDLVLRFTVGNPGGDDEGTASVGITGSLEQRTFASFTRVGGSDQMRTSRPRGGAEEPAEPSEPITGRSGVWDVELVFRSIPGEKNDQAAARFRERGESTWRTLGFGGLGPVGSDGFTGLAVDLPLDSLYVFVAADGKKWRAAPRVDDLSVSSRPAGTVLVGTPAGVAPPGEADEPAEAPQVSDGSWPADAGVIDVTLPPYNAAKDGETDATAAIQRALDAWPSGNRIIYLPAGTYLLSDTLRWGAGKKGQEQKRTILEGAGPERTVLRLADHAAGFGDPGQRRAVIWTGDSPAQRFRNAVRGLCVDTGSGNPGASGIQFNTSNHGTVDGVTIRSGDGQGVAGLDLYFTGEIGNGLVRDLTVVGFDHGVRTTDRVNGMFFQNLTLIDQNVVGFLNHQQVVAIENLSSRGAVPAIRNQSEAVMAVVGGEVVQTSGRGGTAITNDGATLYVRDLAVSGFDTAIDDATKATPRLQTSRVEEYASDEPIALFGTEPSALGLPIKVAPQASDEPLDRWVNPEEFGAVGDGKADDTAALQRAIDSGKAVVYLRAGKEYRIDGELLVRGSVSRIVGTEGAVTGGGSIRVVDGDRDVVVIERLAWGYGGGDLVLEHAADRTLVVRSAMIPQILGTGRGDLFLEDVSSHKWRKNPAPMLLLRNPEQNVWCRNINPETFNSAKIINRGATLWILGLKTENHNACVVTGRGGRTEIIGGHVYAQGEPKEHPAFIVEDASFSAAGVRQYTWKKEGWYEDFVSASRGGQTQVVERADTPRQGALPLLVVRAP